MSKAKFALPKSTKSTIAIAGIAIAEARRNPEGGTLCPITGLRPAMPYGYWVGGRVATIRTSPEEMQALSFVPKLDRWVREARRAMRLTGWKPVGIGWWLDAEGVMHLDVSTWVGDLDAALALGRQRGEQAIWDIAGDREIPC